MIKIFARLISIIFHPLVIISLFCAIYIPKVYGQEVADLVMLLIGAIGILPIVLFNSIQLIRGKISNFDLSNHVERNKTFPLLLLILIILITAGWYVDLPDQLIFILAIYSIMITIFFLFRNRLKISLHASTAYFLSMIIIFSFLELGCYAIAISTIVSISRVILKRHTVLEVIVGGSCGLISGWVASIIH